MSEETRPTHSTDNNETQSVALLNGSVVLSALIGGGITAVIGAQAGNLLLWAISGAAIGLLLALLVEGIFRVALPDAQAIYQGRLVIVVAVEALLVVALVLPFIQVTQAMQPLRFGIDLTPETIEQPYEDVLLTTEDGTPLRGWMIPSENGAAVIVVHGTNGTRTGGLQYAQILAQNGYGVLLFDMRAHGESGGQYWPVGWSGSQDLSAAVDYLLERDDTEQVGVIGLGEGGLLALAAHDLDAIAGYWMDGLRPDPISGAVANFYRAQLTGLQPDEDLMAQVEGIAPRPLAFVASGANDEISFAQSLRASPEDSILWEMPDSGHLAGINTRPGEYARRLLAFFDEAFGF